MGPTIHKLRNTANALGIDLSEDVPELTAGNREFLFTKEVSAWGRAWVTRVLFSWCSYLDPFPSPPPKK